MNKKINLQGTIKVNVHLQILLEDDVFFRLINGSRFQTLTQIMRDEDLETLKRSFLKLKQNETYYDIFTISKMDDTFFDALLICKWDPNLCFNERVIAITFIDINDIDCEYNKKIKNNDKFHTLLTFVVGWHFVYSHKTKNFQVFNTQNGNILFDDLLSVWYAAMISKKYIHLSYLTALEKLHLDIETQTNDFDHCLKISNPEDNIFLMTRFIGKTLYENDIPVYVVGKIMTINESITSNNLLEHKSKFDLQTNVLNKIEITKYSQEKIDSNPDYPITLIIMDIDNFKNVNDTYGHMYGDYVLSKIANIIRKIVAFNGTVGRMGGDEFIIVLHDIGKDDEIRNIVKILRLYTTWAFGIEDSPIKISCSMGISTYPKDGMTYKDLFIKADKALYLAKLKGKNRYIIYDEEKHGSIDHLTKNHTIIEQSKTLITESSFIANIMDSLFFLKRNEKPNFLSIISLINNRYGIERINIFTSEKLRLQYKCGVFQALKEASYITESSYLKHFDENGLLTINNVYLLEGRDDYRFKTFLKRKISATVQVIHQDENKNFLGAISFDMCNSYRLWREYEIRSFFLIGKQILRLLAI